MKNLLPLILILLCLCGCGSIKKAIDEKRTDKAKAQFDRHPDTAAHYCAIRFPVRDSAGKTIYIKADNIDYTPIIDSLLRAADSTNKDSINAAWIGVIDSSTTSIAEYFQKQALKDKKEKEGLQNIIRRLHEQYKPCKPDTLYQEHFTIDGAAIADAEAALGRANKGKADADIKNGVLKDRLNWWKIACIITWAVMGLYLSVLIFKPKL